MQDTQTPPHFPDELSNAWHFVGGAAKPYRVYPPGEDITRSNNYRAATREEAYQAYQGVIADSYPPPDWLANGIPAEAKPTQVEVQEVTAADLLQRKVDHIPCLIEPIFQAVGLAAVVGSSDVGKSAFLRQLAFAVGTGQSHFLDWAIKARYQSAIYVSTEDDENATAFLLYSLNKQTQHDPDTCQGLRFVFDTHKLLAELEQRLARQPADLVVIDAFGDLYGGDANKTNQIRQFLHDYSQLAQKHGCLILWLHHTGKRTDDEAPSKHHVIGGQGFEGKMRLLIELRRDPYDQSIRHLCVVKGNYLPDEYKQESYVLKFEQFLFQPTGERTPFEQLVKPREDTDAGREKYDEIQRLRALGHKGDALARHAGLSKSQVSKLEARYGPKEDAEQEVSSQFPLETGRKL